MAKKKSAERKKAGLALSGGGYRATLFHLGAVWRMNELGLLRNLHRITSVSGGSILAGRLGCKWGDLAWDGDVATNYEQLIAEPVRQFCTLTIDVGSVVKGFLDPFRTAADFSAAAYDEHLYRGATLHDLPDAEKNEGPEFIIYASNLQSGVSFRFTRAYLADYRIGLNHNTAAVRIADAVSASSAFPPILTPKRLRTDPDDWQQDEDPEKRGDLWPNEAFRRKIYLTDGGVYDNMGLEAIFDSCDPVFVSAAGGPFSIEPLSWLAKHSNIAIALRVLGMMTGQTRALRRRMLMRRYIDDKIKGAYWNIGSQVGRYGLKNPIAADSDLSRRLQFVRTRLNHFGPELQGHLINWGYLMADTAIRRWVKPGPAGKWAWPVPGQPL